MNRTLIVIIAIFFTVSLCSWATQAFDDIDDIPIDSLRAMYQRPKAEWPKPTVDAGVHWSELDTLPRDTFWLTIDKDPKVKLGQILFFDPRLSRSNQISCSSCHDPDLAWQDGRKISLGNNHLQGTRNTPSILNTFLYKQLFWDGRADGYAKQAEGPLTAHHEMDMDIKKLPQKLSKIKGYKVLFDSAFGNSEISVLRITQALEAFENIERSRSADFDRFVKGNYKAMNDDEVRGLHLFRTKARCMNCHHGAYFTDTAFHNIGLTYYGRKYQDLGRYDVTKNPDDVGKFKTPSLRDVMMTRPWMHNGLFDNMEGIINMYNSGMPQKPKGDQINDPLFPKTDTLLRPLQLTKNEVKYLVSFMNAITSVPYKMPRPKLPE